MKHDYFQQGDCLPLMRALPPHCVDLIYADPPFFTQMKWERNGHAFDDRWSTMEDYLQFIRVRLKEGHRLLKRTGSIYLHCDPTASHYLKMLMDNIFGPKCYRNEIVWAYRTGGASKNYFSRKHDIILCYGKTDQKDSKTQKNPETKTKFNATKEKSYLTGQLKHSAKNETLEDEWGKYQMIRFSKTDIKLYKDERGYFTLVNSRDAWWDIDALGRTSKERKYPTQKPLPLLERIIKASSNEGDVVLDPFCGSGTTLVAAERLGRRWIGIDRNDNRALIESRIENERTLFSR